MIKKLVILHGRRKWAVIAVQLVGRSGKQCRERFKNQLDPNIKRMAWSEEEVFKNTHTLSFAHTHTHTLTNTLTMCTCTGPGYMQGTEASWQQMDRNRKISSGQVRI